MRESRTWILLCEASRARLFTHDGRGEFSELMAFTHPASRTRGLDLISDKPGRRSEGPGHRSGLSPDAEPREIEAHRFALSLADVLKQGLNRHAYEDLVLAAPPHFLGLLRQAMDGQVTARVRATFDKNFIGLDSREIEHRIFAPVR